MARLVILSEGLTGTTQELAVEKTTIGRVDDNTFPIMEGSISSHHCEILLRGTDVIVRDLSSTNGTFINGHQVTGEAPLKPGQILRLGQVEMRLEDPSAKAAVPKKVPDQTMVIPQGVKVGREPQTKSVSFDKSAFAKKSNIGTKVFIGVVIVIAVGILVMIFIMVNRSRSL